MSTAAVSVMQFVQGHKIQKVCLNNGKEVSVFGFSKNYKKEEMGFLTAFTHDQDLLLLFTPNDDESVWLMQIQPSPDQGSDFHVRTIQDVINALSTYFA